MDPSSQNYDRAPNKRDALKRKLLALTDQKKVGANQQKLLSSQSQAVDPVGLKQALRQMQEAGGFQQLSKPRIAPFGGPEGGRPVVGQEGAPSYQPPTQPGFNRKGSLGNIEAFKAQRADVAGFRNQTKKPVRRRTPKRIFYRG